MGVTLRDHGEVDLSAAEHDVVGDIDIVRTDEAANDLVAMNFAIEAEDIERAVRVLVGAEHEARGRVGPVDPDGGIVRVVLGRLRDHARLNRFRCGHRRAGEDGENGGEEERSPGLAARST